MRKTLKRSDLGQRIETQERRAFVMQQRLKGCTYQEIAQRVREHFGDRAPASYHAGHAWDDLHRAFEYQRAELSESLEEIRQIELERLDQLYHRLWERYDEHGELKVIDRLLKIIELRTRLVGALSPDHSPSQPFIVNIIKDAARKC